MTHGSTSTVARHLTRWQKLKVWCKNHGPMILFACGTVNVIWLLISLFISHVTNQRVVSHRWSRSITLQENIEKHDEGWRANFSFIDGVALSCESRQNGYHDCHPHSVVRFDSHGHARRRTYYDRCPTYEDWCHATWREWDNVSTSEVHGTEYADTWPQMAAVGQFQRLQRAWVYSISFDNNKTIECSQEVYRSIQIGSVHTIRWHRFNDSAELIR